jgi:hypothetical protein
VEPNIKITAKQIRFLLSSGRAWAVHPLHVSAGVPRDLQGYYDVPLDEQRRYRWGTLSGRRELAILRSWVASGYRQQD